jgi:acetoin utilization deacetylase AcuC-like enzyme
MFELIFHPLYNELHELVDPKPTFETYENPMRTRVIWEYFKSKGYITKDFDKNGVIQNENITLRVIKPSPLNKTDILRVHSPYLLELVEHLSSVGYGQIGNMVQATDDSLEIALLSAGGAYLAIKNVFEGNSDQSFALIRPPGHHAIRNESDGLCIFNNIAVAIEKLRADLKFDGKIAILDIDTHYGDGLAKIYYEDPKILYSSIHEYVPGEPGIVSELGAGSGKGFNICYPVPLEADDSYFVAYCDFISPYLNKFKPDMIIVATGFDGHYADPIGNLAFTSKGYSYFFQWIHSLSTKISNGKLTFILEGGYNLAVIPHLAEVLLCEFTENTNFTPFEEHIYPHFQEIQPSKEEIKKYKKVLRSVLEPYWN